MKLIPGLLALIYLLAAATSAYAQTVPSGRTIDLDQILTLGRSFGGFLYVLGFILAGIAVILSGIYYLMSGSNATKVKAAKDMLWASILGAFILAMAAVIIATISEFAQDPLQFFQ